MLNKAGIHHDIKTIRDIEAALEEAEAFIGRVKANKVRLTLQNGNISISREEMAKITDLVITLERSGKALDTAVSYLRELMAYDEVTQMFSRRYIFSLIEKELHRNTRYETPFCILAFEVDVFSNKQTEPKLSDEDRNLVMAQAAAGIRKFVRNSDSPGRTGERTFLVLLPETPSKGAFTLAERIRKAVDGTIETSAGEMNIALSGGIIESGDPAVTDMAGLLYVIDQKLTAAREKGPNVIIKS